MGDDDYNTRSGAQAALLRLGHPAYEKLLAATKDSDPERVWRAEQLVEAIKELPKPIKVDPDCTNGYMPAFGNTRQVQTIVADADVEITHISIRAARSNELPGVLHIALVAGAEPKEEPLATALLNAEWPGPNKAITGVARDFRWIDLPMQATLKKGQTYCLVFSSPKSTRTNPWLINCFYRDAYPRGQHLEEQNEKLIKLGDYDLFCSFKIEGKAVLTTVPDKVVLKENELFGVNHRGIQEYRQIH